MRKLDLYKGKGLLLSSARELEEYFEGLESGGLLTWDWETTGLEYDSIPLGLALHQRGKEPCFCPVDYFFTDRTQYEVRQHDKRDAGNQG